MLRTFIVGLGRSGLGLHWSVLRRLRERDTELFADAPALAWDNRDMRGLMRAAGLMPVPSLTAARRLADPAETVVHLCTPPTARLGLLRQLADLGYRRILVEKPLAAEPSTLPGIDDLRSAHGLRLVVVAQWLDSALTQRLVGLTRSGELGELRSISVAQLKPRLRRTLGSGGHSTAFDVELPHSVGVALRIAGNAEVADAALTDMRVGDLVVPEMGTARLALRHGGGVQTEIFSDLASPVRERRIELEFTGGRAVGHFPGSEEDHYAHLRLECGRSWTTSVFPDDSLAAFFTRVYRDFAVGAPLDAEFTLAMRVVQLLGDAKSHCRPDDLAVPAPAMEDAMEEVMSNVS